MCKNKKLKFVKPPGGSTTQVVVPAHSTSQEEQSSYFSSYFFQLAFDERKLEDGYPRVLIT